MNNFCIYKELQKESLFNEWTDELLELNSLKGNDNYAVEIWNIAKDYAYNIATAEYPVGMFKFCQSDIKQEDPPFCFNVSNTCLACVFTMIYKSADNAVINQIIDYISKNYFFFFILESKIISVFE